MDARKLTKLWKDLAAFLGAVVGTLGNARRRRWCGTYVRGVLLDGQRKSIEPMAIVFVRSAGVTTNAKELLSYLSLLQN
jgi:SRSO17 transposase